MHWGSLKERSPSFLMGTITSVLEILTMKLYAWNIAQEDCCFWQNFEKNHGGREKYNKAYSNLFRRLFHFQKSFTLFQNPIRTHAILVVLTYEWVNSSFHDIKIFYSCRELRLLLKKKTSNPYGMEYVLICIMMNWIGKKYTSKLIRIMFIMWSLSLS